MKNIVLHSGDFVKALQNVETPNGVLTRGQVYLVERLLNGGLGICVISGITALRAIELVRPDGTLTDACLDVTIHKCPVTLPRGRDGTT